MNRRTDWDPESFTHADGISDDDIGEIARKYGLERACVWHRRTKQGLSGEKLRRPVTKSRNGKPVPAWGGKTPDQWHTFYSFWSSKPPCRKSILDSYRYHKSRDKTDEQIITMQKKVWGDLLDYKPTKKSA